MEPLLHWKGYHWMNGQPWGTAHPNAKYTWYADESETIVRNVSIFFGEEKSECLMQGINNTPKYFEEIGQTKLYGCGCVSTCQSFLFGNFHFEYVLPDGIHLWPAIWLSGVHTWPPEIDIMEAWSGNGLFCKNKPNYRRFPLFNNIHPGIYYTKQGKTAYGKGYGSLGSDRATYSWLQKQNAWNTCDLIWRKDLIEVYYNGHRVMRITADDEDRGYYMLDFMNQDMYVCIDCFAGNNFSKEDFEHYVKHGTYFVVKNFVYKPV